MIRPHKPGPSIKQGCEGPKTPNLEPQMQEQSSQVMNRSCGSCGSPAHGDAHGELCQVSRGRRVRVARCLISGGNRKRSGDSLVRRGGDGRNYSRRVHLPRRYFGITIVKDIHEHSYSGMHSAQDERPCWSLGWFRFRAAPHLALLVVSAKDPRTVTLRKPFANHHGTGISWNICLH